MIASAAVLAALAVLMAQPVSPRRRWRAYQRPEPRVRQFQPATVGAVLLPVLGGVLGGWWGLVLGLVLAPVAANAVRRLEPKAARRERELLGEQLAFAVDLLASAVASGAPLARALDAVAAATPEPLSRKLLVIARRTALTGDLEATVSATDPLAPLTRAIRRAAVSGVPVVAVLDDTARELHRDRRAVRRQAAQRVGVRTAAPLGLCFLPAFFLVGIVPALVGAFTSISW